MEWNNWTTCAILIFELETKVGFTSRHIGTYDGDDGAADPEQVAPSSSLCVLDNLLTQRVNTVVILHLGLTQYMLTHHLLTQCPQYIC